MSTDPLPFAVAVRAEATLAVAALIARLPDDDLHALHRVLARPEGGKLLMDALQNFLQLTPAEQSEVIAEIATCLRGKLQLI